MEKKKYISEIPHLMKEWDWEANADLDPHKIVAGCDKRVWWKCSKCAGKWQCHVYARTGKDKTGCPYCAGQKLLVGFNDLETVNPRLASEWHPTKNGNLKPSDVYSNSHTRVWWKCPIGHEYQATVNTRNYAHTNCPICHTRKTTSFYEQAIFYYVKKLWPNSINKYKDYSMGRMEFDIYIPEHKIAIEYDGAQWHKTEEAYEREIKKYNFCKKKRICLIRIKECSAQAWKNTADKIYYIQKRRGEDFSELEKVLYKIVKKVDDTTTIDIDVARDKNEILNYLSKIDNSLAKIRPDLVEKWNYKKNGNLTPDMFSVGSEEIVWWQCPDCDKEWKRSIKGMARNILGCPVCSKIHRGNTRRKLSVVQKGSLAEKMPELAKEWHKTKNGNLTPHDVTVGSGKIAWWQCPKCEYEWKTAISGRGLRHYGCPCCAGKVPKKGVNDLETKYPGIAKEWHPTKNGNLKPSDVTSQSEKRVWWKCSKCGDEWQTMVASRTRRGLLYCNKCKRRFLKKN